jgi:TldD protein
MFDDPTVPGAYGSYFFDDEGEQARSTQILQDGLFVRPISDLASATFAYGFGQGERTPNGRRQDVTRKTYARMTNTFFGRGDTDPQAMIAGVERGIYLRGAESGVEDPMGWGIQVTAHYGEEIVNGQLTGKLYAPVGMTGYVPDLLMSVSAIGSDFELSPGTCGKGYKELVPVSTGGPHLRMRARLG